MARSKGGHRRHRILWLGIKRLSYQRVRHVLKQKYIYTYIQIYIYSVLDSPSSRLIFAVSLSPPSVCVCGWCDGQVFERGLEAISLSVDLWLHYLEYITSQFPDSEAFVRQEYERAVDTCGLEFK